MRITFVLPSISMSGGVKSSFELANRLYDRGHRVRVVYPMWVRGEKEGSFDLRYAINNAQKTARRFVGGRQPDWFDLRAELIRVPTLTERRLPPGDIILATWWANAHTISTCGSDKGEKFYFIRHLEIWGGPPDKVNASYTLPLHRITTSSWLKDLIEQRYGVGVGGPFPNGIDTSLFYREVEGFEAHRPRRVGLLYRTMPWKGMEDGLAALLEARRRFPDIQPVIFGEPPLKSHRAAIDELGGVEFHRFPSPAEMRRIYNSLDIFVFPSHNEGFGNPPMEAMACGVACVSTRVGAVPDYTEANRTALVVEPESPDQLAEAVASLLADEEYRRRLAEAGRKYMQYFTWENTVDRLEALFLNTIEARG